MHCAAPPQGEKMAYSPTSPGGLPGHCLHDYDSMAGAVENDEDVEDYLRDIVMLYQVGERKAARQRQREMIEVMASLGGNARAFRRERAKKTQAIIAEFYLLPRISALATELRSYGIAPGLALDLAVPDENGEPWDFSRLSM